MLYNSPYTSTMFWYPLSRMISTTLAPIAVLAASAAAAAGGVYELEVGFGQGRRDDRYGMISIVLTRL